MGEQVLVVAERAEPRFREVAQRLDVRVIEGSAQVAEVLRQAGIPGARAIVLTSLDDVANVHSALVARSLDPHIDIVVRVFDEDFGQRLAELLPGAIALSASALAAPGFVSAVLGEDDTIALDLLGRRLVVRHAAPDEPGVLTQLADDHAEPVRLWPPPGPGLLSLVDAGPIAAGTDRPTRPPMRSRIGRRIPVLSRQFRDLALVLGLLIVVSAGVFAVLAGVDPVEAVYNAVKAFFGGVDESVVPTPELRLFAIVLTLLGAAALAAFYALIADAVLSRRLADILGTRIPDMDEHVIIAGLGTIGFRIADDLHRRGLTVVAAERSTDSRFIAPARKLGIPVLSADARDPETLRTLGAERAACLVAATDVDAVNLTTALHARTLRGDMRIVVRLFDPELAEHLDRALGRYHARSVSALAAPAFAAAAIGRQVVATIPVGDRRIMVVARLAIDAGSRTEGSTVAREMEAATSTDGGGARCLAIVDGDTVAWAPPPDALLRAGTELVVVANRRGLGTLVARTEGR